MRFIIPGGFFGGSRVRVSSAHHNSYFLFFFMSGPDQTVLTQQVFSPVPKVCIGVPADFRAGGALQGYNEM